MRVSSRVRMILKSARVACRGHVERIDVGLTTFVFDTPYTGLLQLPQFQIELRSRRPTARHAARFPSSRGSTLREKFRDVSLVSAAVTRKAQCGGPAWIRS